MKSVPLLSESYFRLHSLVELEPSNASGFWQRGLCFFEINDYKNAIADLSRTIEINGKNGSAYYQRGLSYLAIEDTKQALADFTKAVLVDDGHVLAHYQRGKLNLNTQQYSQAVADFARVVDYERKFNDQHGILKEAESELEKAKKLAGG